MGFRFSEDGECIVCKIHTYKYCDACKRYICDDHRIEKKVKGSSSKRIFCKECYEKGKEPRNVDLRGLSEEYHF